MSVNKHRPHVVFIPEDDAISQLANGFQQSEFVNSRKIAILPPAGGWRHVVELYHDEYIPYMTRYETAHTVLLIDFDHQVSSRREQIEAVIPPELLKRTFVIGPENEAESLRKELAQSLETIGRGVADACSNQRFELWNTPQLQHNLLELQRLLPILRPILFEGN